MSWEPPQWPSAMPALNPDQAGGGVAKDNEACREKDLIPSLPVVLDSPVKKPNEMKKELMEARNLSMEKEKMVAELTSDMGQAAKLIAGYQKNLKEATKITNLAVEKTEEYRKRWCLAEQRAVAADAATVDARQKEQEASNKMKYIKIKLADEETSKEDAKKRALQAELAANEAAAEVEAVLAQKDRQLKKHCQEKELAEKQAVQIEDGFTNSLNAAQAALQNAEKMKKAADSAFQKELATKNEQIKTLKASSKLAEETKNKANQLDYYRRLAVKTEERVKAAESYSADLQAEINELYGAVAVTRVSHDEQCSAFTKKIKTLEEEIEVIKREDAMLEAKLEREKEEYRKMNQRARDAEVEVIITASRSRPDQVRSNNRYSSKNKKISKNKKNIARSYQSPPRRLFEGTPRSTPLTTSRDRASYHDKQRQSRWEPEKRQKKRQSYEEPRQDLRDVIAAAKSRAKEDKDEEKKEMEKTENENFARNLRE